MSIKTYRWHSPTCECVLIETHDDSRPDDTAAWTGVPEKKCAIHASVPDADVYDVVLRKENQPSQRARAALLEIDELTEMDDQGNPKFIHGAETEFTFEGEGTDRTIRIRLDSKPAVEKLTRMTEQLAERNARGVTGPKNAQLAAKIQEAEAQREQIKTALNANRGKLKTDFDKAFGKDKVILDID